MNSGIYLLTHSATGRKYVGQSRNLSVRLATHASGNSSGAISRAIRELGWDSFVVEVLETCAPSELDEAESRWVAHHDCIEPRGFNVLCPGGRDIDAITAAGGAKRQAILRAKGRQVAVVLRDPDAIAALDQLSAKHGGVTAAVTRALVHAASSNAVSHLASA